MISCKLPCTILNTTTSDCDLTFAAQFSVLLSIGSVGKSADSAFLSASVDDPDDAFVGFTYVAPMEEVLHE